MKKIVVALCLIILGLLGGVAGATDDAILNAQKYVLGESQSLRVATKQIGIFEWKHLGANGELIADGVSYNNLADDGEQIFLDCFLRAQNCPTTFWLRLVDSTSPCSVVDTTTLAGAVGMGEPSSNGYAAQEITRNTSGWVSLALDSGDYMATSSTETFSASGGSWGPVHCAILTNAQTGTSGYLYSYVALSQGRTLASGESLQVTYRIKLQ